MITRLQTPLPPIAPADARREAVARGGIVDLIGNTPLVEVPLAGLAPGVRLLAKAEWLNPGGSVKDRSARGIVLDAESRGLLPSRRLLDASSGNTAIAYAMLGALRGFGVTVCLPGNASAERKALLRAYGAQTVETDPLEGSDGAIRRARQLADASPERYYYADQYNNPANSLAHYQTTGPEIWHATGGRVTHLVAGVGTTGTLMGTGRYLRERRADIQLIAAEPDEAFHGIEGLKHLPTAIVPGLYDASLPDRTVRVATEAAYDMTRRLMREFGLPVGLSSGAAACAAYRVADELTSGLLAVIFPDGADRYLSLGLW